MKNLIIILCILIAFKSNAQHVKHGRYNSSPVFTPATNDTIELSPGTNIIKDSAICSIVPVTTLIYKLPSNPKLGETITIHTAQAVTNIKFINGTLATPVISTKKAQTLHYTYGKAVNKAFTNDGLWH